MLIAGIERLTSLNNSQYAVMEPEILESSAVAEMHPTDLMSSKHAGIGPNHSKKSSAVTLKSVSSTRDLMRQTLEQSQ